MSEATLEFIASTDKALKQIEDFAGKSTQSIGNIEKSFGKVETAANDFAKNSAKSASAFESALGGIKVVAGALIALFAAKQIGEFFGDAIHAASAQEEAINKLNTALAVNGDFTEEASKDFQEFANHLQDTTGAADEHTLTLIALAKSYGATNEQAKQIVETSGDFAAVTKTGVDKAVKELSKTLNGYNTALSKNIPELKNLTTEQKIAGEAIDLLQERLDGAAEALNKTYNGAVKRVSDSYEDLLKSVGAVIVKNPILIGSLNAAADALGAVTKAFDDNKDAIVFYIQVGLDGVAKTLVDVIRLFGFFGNIIDAVKFSYTGVAAAATSWASITLKVVDSVISGFLQIGSLALVPLVNSIELVAEVMNKVGAVSDDSLASIKSIATTLNSTAADGASALSGLIDTVDGYKDSAVAAFESTIDSSGNATKSIVKFADAGSKLYDNIKKVGKGATDTNAIFNKLNESGVQLEKEFEEAAKGADDFKKSLEELVKALEKEEAAKNPIAGFENEAATRLELIQDSLDKGLIKEQEFAELRERINISAAQKIAEETDKINDAQIENELKEYQDFIDTIKKKTSEGLASPFITATQAENALGKPQTDSFTTENAGTISQIVGGIDAALQGAQGAVKAVAGAAGVIADTILPGIGGAVSGIVSVLSQGPDKVKELVQGFAKALPEIIKAIGLALPVVIQTLADNLDEIIIGIAKAIPAIIKAVVKAAPEITVALLAVVPELVKALLEEITGSFDNSGLTAKFKALGDNISSSTRPFLQQISDGIAAIGRGLGQVLGNIVTGITQLLNNIFSGIKPLFDGLFTLLNNTLGKLLDGLGQGISAFGNGLAAAFQSVVTFISNLGPNISAAFQGALDFFGSLGTKLADGFSGLGDGFKNVIKDLSIKIPEFKFPELPSFSWPSLPTFKWPSLPSFSWPSLPTFKWPSLPKFEFPDLPSLPKFSWPKLPSFEFPSLPSFKWPSLPSFKFPDLPEIKFPDIPEIKIPILQEFLDKIGSIGGGGGGGGNFISNGFDAVKSFFGFADGGMVPSGFPNDTFPARLSSGEYTIDKDLTQRLESFLSQQGNGGSSQPVKVVLQVGEKQLADILLNINRQGFRTT